MPKKSNYFIILIGFFIFLQIFSSIQINKQEEIKEINSLTNKNIPKSSGYWILNQTIIDGDATGVDAHNWTWVKSQPWFGGGDGNWSTPYIIENITARSPINKNAFEILDSRVYVTVRNCTFLNATGAAYGLRLKNVGNCTITNTTIHTSSTGLYMDNCQNVSIIDNDFINCTSQGIDIRANSDFNNISGNYINGGGGTRGIYVYSTCENNTIFNNEVTNHGMEGIYLYNCKNNTVSENIVYENDDGIYLKYMGNHIISGNIVYNNTSDGIVSYDNDNDEIFGNTLTNNFHGIYITGSENNTLMSNVMSLNGLRLTGSKDEMSSHDIPISNTVNGKPLYYYRGETDLGKDNFTNAGQITLVNCNNSFVSSLNISYGSWPLTLYYCRNNTVFNNTVSHSNFYGIFMYLSENCSILENYGVDNSYHLVGLSSSNNNTISKNEAYNNRLYGIHLTASDNCTITNNNMSNHDCGIYLQSSSLNNTIYNNTCSNNENYGIYIATNCEDNKLIKNKLYSNEDYGIFLATAENTTVFLNTISKNKRYGIYIYRSDESIVENNTIDNNLEYGIYINDAPKIIIKNNNFTNNGMQFDENVDDLVTYDIDNSNKMNGKILYCYISQTNLPTSSFIDAGKVILINTSKSQIEDLKLFNSSIGILSWFSHNNSFSNITIYNQDTGIFFRDSDFNNVTDCHIMNNTYGIYNILSDDCYFLKNNISFNSNDGVYMELCTNGNFSDNTLYNNTNYGYYLDSSSGFTIRNNTISNNLNGLYIKDISSHACLIYLNNFSSNLIHAIDEGVNDNWNNGTHGNYWDNFTGKDIDDDGIGDSIYTIGAITDTKPLWWDAPFLNLTSPINFTLYASIPPIYNATVEEGRGQRFWYEFNQTGGRFFSFLTATLKEDIDGQIDQGLWDALSSGNVLISFYINDSRGYISNADVIVIVDKIAPTITLNVAPQYSNGITIIEAYNTTEVISGSLLANVSTPSGNIYPVLTYQGGNLWNGSFDVALYDSGIYTIQVNGTDLAGNVGYASAIITGDLNSPAISLTVSPQYSNGITIIEAYNTSEVISGSLLANVSTPAGYIYPVLTYQGANLWNGSFDVALYDGGIYTIQVNGTDLASNVGYATPATINGDLISPAITITVSPSVTNGIAFIEAYNTTEVISGSLLANVSLPAGGYIYPSLTYQGANLWNGSFDVSLYDSGTYTVYINGTDLAGNVGYATPEVITGDLTNPTILLTNPNPYDLFGTDNPSYSILIIADYFETAWYTLDGGFTNHTITGAVVGDNEGVLSSASWSGLDSGFYLLNFYVNETSGNIVNASVWIEKDNTPPFINITSPQDFDEFIDIIPSFIIEVNDTNLDSTWYSLYDGKNTFNETFSVNGTFNAAYWNVLEDGTIFITFYANDTAGNINWDQINVEKKSSDSGSSGGSDDDDTTPTDDDTGEQDNIMLFIIIGIIAAAAITGILLLTQKSKKKIKQQKLEIQRLQQDREEITEDDIKISKEKHICLVHKGPIEGYSFICPSCGAYYCMRCAKVLETAENECWSCGNSLDSSKAKKPIKGIDEAKPKVKKTEEIHKKPQSDIQETNIGDKKITDSEKEKPKLTIKTESIKKEEETLPEKKSVEEKLPESSENTIDTKKDSPMPDQAKLEKISEYERVIEDMKMTLEKLDNRFRAGAISEEEYSENSNLLGEKLGEAIARLNQLKEE